MAQDPGDQDTADLARLVEALHPSKEEDERAERFAARLLEHPATVDAGAAQDQHTERQQAELVAAEADAGRRSWQRDVLMAAIGAVVGVIATLVVVSIS